MHERILMLCLVVASNIGAERRPGDWSGNYPPCERHGELLKRGGITAGVRFSTSNRRLAKEFARAMDFWAGILDMRWHIENSQSCTIQILDGDPGLFRTAEIARAQFPGTPSFQGWIAFRPGASAAPEELFMTSVHEIGHVLGLLHNPSSSSVMYFLGLDRELFLDEADLAGLAQRYTLRASVRPSNVSWAQPGAWQELHRVRVR